MASLLEEKDAIRELIAEYCFRIDQAEFDRWGELFTEDASFEVVGMFKHQGRDTLLRFIKNIPLNPRGLPGFKHCTLNQVIEVDGEKARARCYILVVNEGNPLRINIAGRYEDTLVKQRGRWLFSSRTVTFDYQALPTG